MLALLYKKGAIENPVQDIEFDANVTKSVRACAKRFSSEYLLRSSQRSEACSTHSKLIPKSESVSPNCKRKFCRNPTSLLFPFVQVIPL